MVLIVSLVLATFGALADAANQPTTVFQANEPCGVELKVTERTLIVSLVLAIVGDFDVPTLGMSDKDVNNVLGFPHCLAGSMFGYFCVYDRLIVTYDWDGMVTNVSTLQPSRTLRKSEPPCWWEQLNCPADYIPLHSEANRPYKPRTEDESAK